MTKPTIMVTPHLAIFNHKIKDIPLWHLDYNNREEDSLRTLEKKIKEICGDPWDNSHIKFTNIFGDLFSIGVGLNGNKWGIHIWNVSGNTTICNVTQNLVNKETDKMSNEVFNIIDEKTCNFTRGLIDCGECGKTCKRETIGRNRYFAGIYCDECWESKWKAIEAKENYN